MRRLLLVSPHFPPDSSAGTHRARLLAPHLAAHGWLPTVLTVDPRDYEGRLDERLEALVPPDLDVVRVRALDPRWTRRVGVGDLGLRALPALARASRRLLDERRYDALLVTIYPTYPALLGPLLRWRRGVPFVLDYQDPWVGSWGRTVGGGAGGRVDGKSRASRALASLLEPVALAAADAVTAVSDGTLAELAARWAPRGMPPTLVLPIGFDEGDLAGLRLVAPPASAPVDAGTVRLCAPGTLLPSGGPVLDALLAGVARLRAERPSLAARVRLHFLGTSNSRDDDAPRRAIAAAVAHGVADLVEETAPRLDYLDTLAAQARAHALVLLGSIEPHYTASRLFPALLARRPLLAIYHRASSVCAIARAAAPAAHVIDFADARSLAARIDDVARALAALVEAPAAAPAAVSLDAIAEFSAPRQAGRLARLLDDVVGARTRSAA